MEKGRYFLREQPVGTWIDYLSPWPKVVKHSSVVTQYMDQCMTGAKDDEGWPVKKPTEWTANSTTLLAPLSRYCCDGRHDHGHPTGQSLERLKRYTWKLCGIVVQGVQDLKAELETLQEVHGHPHPIACSAGRTSRVAYLPAAFL